MTTHGASHVLDVTDPNNGYTFAVYECRECAALIQYENIDGHRAWHRTSGTEDCPARAALARVRALAEEFEDRERAYGSATPGTRESGLEAAYGVAADRIRRAIEGTA